jgi:hypothetical protein
MCPCILLTWHIRTKIARRRMEELRLADLRLWLAVQLARLWRKKKGMDLLVALRLERERRCRAAVCFSPSSILVDVHSTERSFFYRHAFNLSGE